MGANMQNMESLRAMIDQLKFENDKLNQQLLHKDKLYEQKILVLESNINGKEAINSQLKTLKENAEKQLIETQNANNQLTTELITVRKKQYLRLPRNNDSVSMKVRNAQSGGCCSSWWGKKDTNSNNTDPKTMHLNITNSINSTSSN